MVVNLVHRLLYAFVEWRHRKDYTGYVVHKADPLTAALMPDLGLPRMTAAARTAFRSVLRHEKPTANMSVHDILRLAEARGYVVHPSDWIPKANGTNHFPSRYEIWAEWLAAHGYSSFWEGVPLTLSNARRFQPDALGTAFRILYGKDRSGAYELLLKLAKTQPVMIRCALLNQIGGGASFSGNYPSDVPILRHFISDSSEKVRDLVREKLRKMAEFETAEAHAEHIAWHLEVQAGCIKPSRPEYATARLSINFYSTTIDALANALSLDPVEVVNRWDRALFEPLFWSLISTGSVAVRTAYAEQRLSEGKEISAAFMHGCTRALWERGLRSKFHSPYPFSVNDFLGPEIGTIDETAMQDIGSYQYMKGSILHELKTGKTPNKHDDPLRVLGLAVNKNAAAQVLREAIAFGMSEDNARLSMLKLNLQL